MVYAKAHDQAVADDYFAAMERVEQRLQIGDAKNEETIEDVKVQEPEKLSQLIEQLEVPELWLEERLGIASQLREMFVLEHEHPPPTAYYLFPTTIGLLLGW